MNDMFPYAKQFRRFAEGICRYPQMIRIQEAWPSTGKVVLNVTAHPTDAKFLCGRGCQTIQALQLIFKAIAAQANHHITINVAGNGLQTEANEPLFKVKESWDKTPEALDLMATCLEGMELKGFDLVSEEHHDTTMITLRETPDLPEKLMAALNEAFNEWGKGQGRRIMVLKPGMVRAA